MEPHHWPGIFNCENSRGRAITGPRPLRSTAFPEGLPNLTSAERARVSSANILYELVARVVTLAVERNLLVVVENPRSSLFWQTRFWKSIAHLVRYTAHQACAYGGDRPKWTVLAWNHVAFSALNKTCPGTSNLHEHKPWGLVHSCEGTHFSTSEETAYPKPLAMAIASTFAKVMIAHGWSPPAEEFPAEFELNLKTMRALATSQPKASQMPPVVREHKSIIVIRGPFQCLSQAPVQAMQRLKQAWVIPTQCDSPCPELPAGAQLLRFTPLRSKGGILQTENSYNAESAEQAWGIPFGPDEFIYEAVKRGHPRSFSKLVPDILYKAIDKNFASGSSSGDLANTRARWFSRWMERAKALAGDEETLKAGLPKHVKHILAPKRLLLWKEILAELNYPDAQVSTKCWRVPAWWVRSHSVECSRKV